MTSAAPSSDVQGTVSFGFAGTPGSKRLDAYGVSVNTTAALNSREPGISMTPQVFRPAAQRRPAPQYDQPAYPRLDRVFNPEVVE